MESKDVPPRKAMPLLAIRPKRVSLQLDPSYQQSKREESTCTTPSPSSATTSMSPETPVSAPRPPSSGEETADADEEDKEPESGPMRTRSKSKGSGATKEKRKRSRVTPEQLVHLEQLFLEDRSPTAARRREISDQLGMQERQTQIWFQNRRAKAKLQEGKSALPVPEVPPADPPALATGYEADLHTLIHEDEHISLIPCTDLSIGSWRRIASTVGKHDLVAYMCEAKRCLTWFIQSGGQAFKMELPFDTIVGATFTNSSPGSGMACFCLNRPPLFYLEQISSPRPSGSISRYWKRCSDWTEDFQATRVLRHDLLGSAVQLARIVRNLQSNFSTTSEPGMLSPSYGSGPPESPLSPISPMELPAPPLAALANAGYQTWPGPGCSNEASDNFRRHSLALPNSISDPSPPHDTLRAPHTAPTGSFPSSTFNPISDHGLPMPAAFGDFSGFPSPGLNSAHPSRQMGDFDASISHVLSPRPYSSLQRTFYEEQRVSQVMKPSGLRRQPSSNTMFTPPNSSPILTTPFHPPPHVLTDSEAVGSETPALSVFMHDAVNDSSRQMD